MSGGSLVASEIARLGERFVHDVKYLTQDQERIDRFGAAIAPFGLLPSICVMWRGAVSLTAVCRDGETPPIRALTDAGYTVGAPGKGDLYSDKQNWLANCSGHGLEFQLHFTTVI